VRNMGLKVRIFYDNSWQIFKNNLNGTPRQKIRRDPEASQEIKKIVVAYNNKRRSELFVRWNASYTGCLIKNFFGTACNVLKRFLMLFKERISVSCPDRTT
jgi:hypothetical protein